MNERCVAQMLACITSSVIFTVQAITFMYTSIVISSVVCQMSYKDIQLVSQSADSTVTGSRICGCFSKPRCDFRVTRGWQQMLNAVRWIKQFAKKITAVSRLSERDGSSAYCNATQWHRHCHWINNANSSPLDRLNRFCLMFPQAVLPNNCAVFKNWSDDGGIPNSKSVSRKTSTLKPFEIVQASIVLAKI